MEFPLKEDDLFIIEKEVENMIMQTKENINKGYLEFQIANDTYKETLSFDVSR